MQTNAFFVFWSLRFIENLFHSIDAGLCLFSNVFCCVRAFESDVSFAMFGFGLLEIFFLHARFTHRFALHFCWLANAAHKLQSHDSRLSNLFIFLFLAERMCRPFETHINFMHAKNTWSVHATLMNSGRWTMGACKCKVLDQKKTKQNEANKHSTCIAK